MIKVNFILSPLVLIFVVSCNNIKDKNLDEIDTFKFPKIIDKFKSDSLELTSENWLNYGDHHPYYIGKMSDKITIEWILSPTPPPPKANTASNCDPEYKKGEFDNYFVHRVDNRVYKRRDSVELLIEIDTTQTINNRNRKAYPVLIQNKSSDTAYIGYGSQIPIITEAKTKNGQWKPIEERFVYLCGVGLHSIILPPEEIVISSTLAYSGKFKTKLRLKLGDNYSKEFEGMINESQFESIWNNN